MELRRQHAARSGLGVFWLPHFAPNKLSKTSHCTSRSSSPKPCGCSSAVAVDLLPKTSTVCYTLFVFFLFLKDML